MTITKRVEPGRYYQLVRKGLIEVSPAHQPCVWVCRRLTDYRPAAVPVGAQFTYCEQCGFTIAYNPASPVVPGSPKICFQCAGIEPLPMDETP